MKFKAMALVIFFGIILSSCSISHGVKIDVPSAERIQVGVTKKGDIVQMFGQPPIRRSGDGFEMWTYTDSVEHGDPVLLGTTGHDTTTLVLNFKEDVVSKCQITKASTSKFSSATQDSHPCGSGDLNMDKSGVTPATTGKDSSSQEQDYAISAPGKYLRVGNSTDHIDLNPDGTFFVIQDKKTLSGTYKIQGKIVTLTLPTGRTGKAYFNATNILTDDDGIVWKK